MGGDGERKNAGCNGRDDKGRERERKDGEFFFLYLFSEKDFQFSLFCAGKKSCVCNFFLILSVFYFVRFLAFVLWLCERKTKTNTN